MSSELSVMSESGDERYTGYEGVANVLFDEIYFQFFQTGRLEQNLKNELMDKAIG